MYTLVSASVLAADLARHPAGIGVVDVLEAGLRLDAAGLRRLGGGFRDDAERAGAWAEVDQVCGARVQADTALSDVRRRLSNNNPDRAGLAEAADVLSRAQLGGLHQMVELVTAEILGWTTRTANGLSVQTEPAGVTAVTDALGAAYASPSLTVASASRLREPWVEYFGVLPVVGTGAAFGPESVALRALIDRLATLAPAQWTALHDVHWEAIREAPAWAPTMHLACSAAFIAGRVREVAAAQLAASRAVQLARLSAPLAARGVMTAVGSTVQAVAVRDLIEDEVYERLTATWRRVFGEEP